MQTKLGSFIESNVNTFIGFIGSMLIWEFVVKPMWHLPTGFLDNLTITFLFTVWSIARGYGVRRYVNWRHYRKAVPKLVAKSPGKMPFLIGITGRAGVGKDTLAGFLGYPTDAFAATLKAMMAAAGLPEPASRREKEHAIAGLGFSWRRAAQRLGTEWGRSLNPDMWRLLMERRCRASNKEIITITDVRFENEAEFIRKHGILCHVDGRETTVHGLETSHASEFGVSKQGGDYCILNAGDLKDLKQSVETFRAEYIKPSLDQQRAGQ